MADEPDKPRGSSWQRWVAASGADRPAPPRPPAGATDDLDVTLHWPAGEEPLAHGPVPPAPPAADPAPRSTGLDGAAADPLPAVPLLPAIAGRVDALDGQLRALAMRVDGLASASREAESRAEDHRRATERALAELGRGQEVHGEALDGLAERFGELAAGVAALVEDARAPAPIPEPPAPADLSGVEARLDAVAAQVAELADRKPPTVELAAIVGRVAALEKAVERLLALVELVVDTMPASAEGSAAGLAQQVADAVAARLGDRR